MRTGFAGAALIAALLTAGAALAQDAGLAPNYGEVRGIGYPDPYMVSLTAGGPERIAAISGGCQAYMTQAPDVRYRHDPAQGLPLILSVRSDADTVLIVNAPDGTWACDDDGGEGLNPSIRFETPAAGAYDIWVGTYGPQPAPATLGISEMSSF